MAFDSADKREGKVHSFLMIGQSNMAGRGDFGEVEEIINEKCFMLRNGRWQYMREPINPDRMIFQGYNGSLNLHSGVGLAASFADAYANHYGEEVGLIPCADGGTSLSEWQPGELLYDHAVMQTKLALRTSELKGILWHQGEDDCRSAQNVKDYFGKFMKMIDQLRKDTGIPDDTPILIGEIAQFVKGYNGGALKYVDELNLVLRSIVASIPSAEFVPVGGLECRFDGIHFSSRAYRELGLRYFEGYQSIIQRRRAL